MRLRHIWFGIAIALIAALLTGCGGSGTAAVTTTSRVLAGFVYAKGNALGGGADVVITSSANPPTGYFAPSSGTVTLSVADGTLTRAADSQIFDMSISNAIVVTAKAAPSSSVSVSGQNLVLNSVSKTLTPYSVNLGLIASTGTVELITSPAAPSYTPGTPVALKYTINGNAPAAPKELFIAGANDAFGPRVLACVGLDSNGVINPSASFTLGGSAANGFIISGASPSFTISPDSAASSAVEGDSTFTVGLVGQNVTGSFIGNFSYGTVTTVAVTPGATSLLWNTAGAPATTSIGVVVTNQYGAAMFGQTVNLTNPGKTTANVWNTQAGANAFTAISGVTGTTGSISTTLTAPVSAVAGGGLTTTPKGANTITATVGSTVGTASVKVIRPLNSVSISGPSTVNIGTTTPLTGVGSFSVDSGVDVDGDNAPLTDYPATTFTYTCTNTAGGATFGNTGDTGVKTTAVASLLAGNSNQVVAGNVAGQYTMQVTGGVVTPSNTVTTQVVGIPAKIFLTPNTNTTNVIAGAQGNYSGIQGATVNSSFVFLDSYGHTIPNGEVTYNSIFSIDALTGGNMTSGGSGVNSFTLTFGANDGLVHLATTSGTWSPSTGGSFPFNLSKDIGHDKTP